MSGAAEREPMPTKGKTKVLDVVVRDLQDRAETGLGKYGEYLHTQNGRDPMWDLYQELLDGVMYCRQVLLEREGK